MPHRGGGHTTIEMADRRSPHRGHESPRAHRGPVEGAHHPGPPHDTHHNGNGHRTHGNNHLSPGHHGDGHSNGHGHGDNHGTPTAPRRTGRAHSPHADGHIATPHSASNNALNHHTSSEHLPALSRGRRDTAHVDTEAGRPALTPLAIGGAGGAGGAQPLLEADTTKPQPPLAGPEVDDLTSEDDIPNTAEAHPGVDDGFFGNTPEGDSGTDHDDDRHNEKGNDDDGTGAEYPLLWDKNFKEEGEDGKTDDVDGYNDTFLPGIDRRIDVPFPYAPEFGPGVQPRVIPDVNVYQQKKNLAQGMMDLALLSANANQLRYVLEASGLHPYYYPSLIFISASLILQIAVGVGLLKISQYDVKNDDDICKANYYNNITVIGVFLITVINVLLGAFVIVTRPLPA